MPFSVIIIISRVVAGGLGMFLLGQISFGSMGPSIVESDVARSLDHDVSPDLYSFVLFCSRWYFPPVPNCIPGCLYSQPRMGYRSLEWNWPKEAMNRPIWAGIVDGAKLF